MVHSNPLKKDFFEKRPQLLSYIPSSLTMASWHGCSIINLRILSTSVKFMRSLPVLDIFLRIIDYFMEFRSFFMAFFGVNFFRNKFFFGVNFFRVNFFLSKLGGSPPSHHLVMLSRALRTRHINVGAFEIGSVKI